MSRVKDAVTDVKFTLQHSRTISIGGRAETLYQYTGDNGATLMFHTRLNGIDSVSFTLVKDHSSNALGLVAAPLVFEQFQAALKKMHASISTIEL